MYSGSGPLTIIADFPWVFHQCLCAPHTALAWRPPALRGSPSAPAPPSPPTVATASWRITGSTSACL